MLEGRKNSLQILVVVIQDQQYKIEIEKYVFVKEILFPETEKYRSVEKQLHLEMKSFR